MEELEGMRRLEDRYRIYQEIGRGGMGTVYLAEDPRIGVRRVIKLIRFEDLPGSNRNRFLHEAQAIAAIRHPNVASIVEFGRAESGYYVVTEFMEGETLRKFIETGKLGLKDTIRIARQVATALAAAHQAGIVHRDIKPENIFVKKSGDVSLIDFGIAKVTGDRSIAESSSFVMIGAPGYMSPEQVLGHNIGPRSDLWSLGVVLYEMASQHLPFEGGSPEAMVTSILRNDVPKHILAPELEKIVTKALQKREKERYQTAEEMEFDLKKLEKKILDSEIESVESIRKRETPSLFGRLLRRFRKEDSVVQTGGELSGAEESPKTLYINLWIEDESKTRVKLPARLKSEAAYTFLFAIERWSREENGITETFVEPSQLKEQPKTPVVIELLCPFLVTEDESGYIRREVDYISGFGFAPVSFPLKPKSVGSFFLTARLIVKGETIYREVLPLEVVRDDTSESLTADTLAVATQELR